MPRRNLVEDVPNLKTSGRAKGLEPKRRLHRILVKGGINFSIINNTRNKKIVECDKNVVHKRKSGTWGEQRAQGNRRSWRDWRST